MDSIVKTTLAELLSDDFKDKDHESQVALRKLAIGIDAMLGVAFSGEVIVGFTERLLGGIE